jgi:4'-phosphopantetheinyl transferase
MIAVLPSDEAHLWYVRPEAASDPALLQAYDALQTDEERARGARFVFERSRHQHRVTRALVRSTLSRYAAVPPEAWRFAVSAHGRPEISAPTVAPGLGFNLSHADGMIVCLVARNLEIGVDVEDAARVVEFLGIGQRFFSTAESAALASVPEERRGERFFQLWTLKESYIKARGLGLSLPLSAFSFHLGGERIDVSFAPPIVDEPASWQFDQLRIGRHLVATAVRMRGTPVTIRVRETIPLRDWNDLKI